MKEYRITYYLDDMLHTYIEVAENEYNAISKCLNRIPVTSRNLMRNLKIERYIQEWN